MISKLSLEHILFLDIETVPETEQFSDFVKRLAHSSSDFIALEKLSINTVPS